MAQAVVGLDLFLFQCLATLFVAISMIFTYCYFGQKITTKCEEIANVIYATKWYEFPQDEQKYLMLMMIRAQRPFAFSGYFCSTCALATFKAVFERLFGFLIISELIDFLWSWFQINNSAFSYFMILRALEWAFLYFLAVFWLISDKSFFSSIVSAKSVLIPQPSDIRSINDLK